MMWSWSYEQKDDHERVDTYSRGLVVWIWVVGVAVKLLYTTPPGRPIGIM